MLGRHGIRQGQVESLRLRAVLGVLVAERVRRAIFGDDSAWKSPDDDRGPYERSIREFLVVSDRSHTANPSIAAVEHPAFNDDGF